MKFNTKTRYGLRTMLELAVNGQENAVYQKEISENQEISFKYLDHLISSLKSAGLIQNSAGRNSGYVLSKDSEKINVYDVYKAFEPELTVLDCLGDDSCCKRQSYCAAKDFWYGLNRVIVEYMESTSLLELSEKQKKLNNRTEESMYYI